ncbi:hypothetical protein F4677DRAFT_447965 [Hypoxylon crocopeplum]|nr:hypothetical protein F4677DRAFT_447965 [Hypoxylon crocopeplum]
MLSQPPVRIVQARQSLDEQSQSTLCRNMDIMIDRMMTLSLEDPEDSVTTQESGASSSYLSPQPIRLDRNAIASGIQLRRQNPAHMLALPAHNYRTGICFAENMPTRAQQMNQDSNAERGRTCQRTLSCRDRVPTPYPKAQPPSDHSLSTGQTGHHVKFGVLPRPVRHNTEGAHIRRPPSPYPGRGRATPSSDQRGGRPLNSSSTSRRDRGDAYANLDDLVVLQALLRSPASLERWMRQTRSHDHHHKRGPGRSSMHH